MERIEKSIEVDVPVSTCYNQWTQFESFPSFMEGVVEVQQLDDKRLRWVAEIGGERKEWTAEIVEQRPDEVISWRSTSGAMNNGSVTFTEVAPNRTKVTLIMTYELVGFKEKLGDALGVLKARVESDLKRFKEFIETQQVPTGAWRGEIREGQVRTSKTALEEQTGGEEFLGSPVEAEAPRFKPEKKK
ncbi:MAG: hypothetical protein QOJ26_323 [Thermoplasmata archaeon]|jgi:uncharacterized membrane protein|nr:hypothetical protein [Thermoplasmata archaeon]